MCHHVEYFPLSLSDPFFHTLYSPRGGPQWTALTGSLSSLAKRDTNKNSGYLFSQSPPSWAKNWQWLLPLPRTSALVGCVLHTHVCFLGVLMVDSLCLFRHSCSLCSLVTRSGSFTILLGISQFSHIVPSLNFFSSPSLHGTFTSCQETN